MCVCDAQIFQSMLKLRGSTFLLSYIHQRNHESIVLSTSTLIHSFLLPAPYVHCGSHCVCVCVEVSGKDSEHP